MKTMLEKQVYATVRNVVALTFIISECSGKLKLRMCYGQTRPENSMMATKFKMMWISELTRLMNIKFRTLVFGILN